MNRPGAGSEKGAPAGGGASPARLCWWREEARLAEERREPARHHRVPACGEVVVVIKTVFEPPAAPRELGLEDLRRVEDRNPVRAGVLGEPALRPVHRRVADLEPVGEDLRRAAPMRRSRAMR